MSPRWSRRAAVLVLLAGVAVAFADSSIVVLALPDLLRQFDVSILSVAWTITAYNLAVAVGALALAWGWRGRAARRVALFGTLLFVAASLLCGFAWALWPLVAFRSVQGLGAALLLVGALPLLRRLSRAGTVLWAGAGVFGAALGPAAGGALTQLLSWRAIFFAQAPIAALALLVTAPSEEAVVDEEPQAGRLHRLAAHVALALTSAALVGLLFLSVVLLVDVWRLSPLAAAAVVSAIPAATLLGQPAAARLGAAATVTGAVLLAGGLAGMAFLPSRSVAWVVVSLTIAGAGLGLVVTSLSRVALSGRGAGATTVWVRHAGLVGGLLVLTPLLAGDLSSAGERAKLEGIATVLDAPANGSTKLQLAVDLAPVLSRPASQGLPDFTHELEPAHDPARLAIGRRLDEVVHASVTRGFRPSFLVAALIALLAVLPGRALLPPPTRRRGLRGAAAASVAAAALLGGELARGALSFGERPRLLPPCAERPPPPGGFGQRTLLTALDEIACRLHRTREQLVADIAATGVESARLVERLERYANRSFDLRDWLPGG